MEKRRVTIYGLIDPRKQSIAAKSRYESIDERKKTGRSVSAALQKSGIMKVIAASRGKQFYQISGERLAFYSRTPKARLATSLRMLGRPVSAETRLKLSIAMKGRKRSPDAIEASAAGHRGKKYGGIK